MLLYFLLGSGIPLTLFSIEFSQGYSKGISNQKYWDLYNKIVMVYSPLFIYAGIAGFLIPNYIIPAYQYFKSLKFNRKIHGARKWAVNICIFISVAVAVTDFNGGATAIWELKPPYTDTLRSHFVQAGISTPIAERVHYKLSIRNSINNGKSSYTRYAYFFSVLIEAFFLNLFFFNSFFYAAFRKSLKKQNERQYYKGINGLIISSLLIFIWLLLRSMNTAEKQFLYPDKELQTANVAIGCLNLICLVAVTISSIADAKVRKLAQEILAIATTLGISIASIFGYFNQNSLVEYFGRQGSIYNYVVFPIVFVLLFAANYVIELGSEYNDDNDGLSARQYDGS